MLNDTVRNEAYQEAIAKKVKQGFTSVLDVGTGTGLLRYYIVSSIPKGRTIQMLYRFYNGI